MKYVLNASVAFKWAVPEIHADKALRLRDDFRTAVHELLAPDVFPAEVGHALARAERRKLLVPPQGSLFLADILSTPLRLFPSYPDLIARAFAIASQMRIGVYDCLYVALAEQEGCELVTADAKPIENLQPQFPFIVPLAVLP